MSGRAPSTCTALPTNTFPSRPEVGSPGSGSRQMLTSDTPMSSTAHPVTASEPTTFWALSVGVSTTPSGAVVPAYAWNCTGTLSGELGTPGAVSVTIPDNTVPAG